MIRSYSSAVNPRPRARSRVTFGSAEVKPSSQARLAAAAAPQLALPLPLDEGTVLDEAAEERVKDLQPVGAAHRRLGGPLGVRHHPEHGAVLVDDAGNVLGG